jgi:sortase (surface protein transpeptidase)
MTGLGNPWQYPPGGAPDVSQRPAVKQHAEADPDHAGLTEPDGDAVPVQQDEHPDDRHCEPSTRNPRRTRLLVDALIAALAVTGIIAVAVGGAPAATNTARPPAPSASPGEAEETQGPPAPKTARIQNTSHAIPVHLDIPAINVSTGLTELGLNPDGTIAVPPVRANAPAGWYRYLASPGEVGPAVILGHVDTAHEGPAVFYRLRELRPGDAIAVARADGRTAVFTVREVTEYEKATFPADTVYGPVDHPELRLITCGGTFDHLRKTYRGNVVVYAALTSIT